MKTRFTAFIISLISMGVTQKSFAWGAKGHELVAEIAFHFLDDSTKKIVRDYLGDMSLGEAANWMDNEKSNSYYNYMRTWHYVNVEKGDTYKPTTERDIITVLHSAIQELKNYKNVKRKDIKRDLLLIFHLIGDLHQPLHVGYGIDRGGNDIDVNSPVVSGNLHSIWDSQIIDNKRITLDSCLALYPTLDPNIVRQVQKVSVLNWMNDSRSLLDTVYNFQDKFLTPDYVDRNVKMIEKQLLYGGLRLAAVLTEAFNPSKAAALPSKS